MRATSNLLKGIQTNTPAMRLAIKTYLTTAKIILFLLLIVFCLSLYNLGTALIIQRRLDNIPVITDVTTAVVMASVIGLIILMVLMRYLRMKKLLSKIKNNCL